MKELYREHWRNFTSTALLLVTYGTCLCYLQNYAAELCSDTRPKTDSQIHRWGLTTLPRSQFANPAGIWALMPISSFSSFWDWANRTLTPGSDTPRAECSAIWFMDDHLCWWTCTINLTHSAYQGHCSKGALEEEGHASDSDWISQIDPRFIIYSTCPHKFHRFCTSPKISQ